VANIRSDTTYTQTNVFTDLFIKSLLLMLLLIIIKYTYLFS